MAVSRMKSLVNSLSLRMMMLKCFPYLENLSQTITKRIAVSSLSEALLNNRLDSAMI